VGTVANASRARILKRDSGFWGLDLTLVRNNTVALVFNSGTFKVAFWCRHKCRCPAPVPCLALDYFSSRVTVSTTLGRVTHWEYLLSKTTCWVMIKFALPMTSYDNLVILTALRMVNIFLVLIGESYPWESYPWRHLNCYNGTSLTVDFADATHEVKVQHLGTIFRFSIRKMHSLTIEWSGSRVHLSPRSFSVELKWLE
jgi:hypothetical protein